MIVMIIRVTYYLLFHLLRIPSLSSIDILLLYDNDATGHPLVTGKRV